MGIHLGVRRDGSHSGDSLDEAEPIRRLSPFSGVYSGVWLTVCSEERLLEHVGRNV